MSDQVHWSEGLFLQPHHLQAMQRGSAERAASERRLAWAYPYGLIEARLSPDALENHAIRFSHLRAVMPSGLVVNVPHDTDLPPLNIKRAFESSTEPFTVSLGVPLWQHDRGNTVDPAAGDDWRTKRVFRVAEVTRPDENTGENPQPLLVRRTNARLLLDEDDRTDLEVLPLLRIAHASGQDAGLPRQDQQFIPPCLLLGGSVVLRDLVRDLANQVEASRKDLAQQMARGGFTVETIRGPQFEQLLRLRTLARHASVLPSVADAPVITPFQAYLQLRELLEELACFHPEREEDFEVAAYDHDNPAVSFQELEQKIRRLIRVSVPWRVLKVSFEPRDGALAANLTDEHLNQPNEYFLGIETREDPRTVAALVHDPDRFKLMSLKMVRTRVGGVRLQEERQPPLQLRPQPGLTYFRLLRGENPRMWEMIKQEKTIAATWPGIEGSDFKLTLYMPLPEISPAEAPQS